MTQLPWHNYSGESAGELFSLVGAYRVDSLVVAFEAALDEKAMSHGLAALSEAERDVLAVESLEREINNGGYGQFFLNSSRVHVGQVVHALKRIGCPITAAITERAIASLPNATSLTPEAVLAIMGQDDPTRDAMLNECDQAYYGSGENIAQHLLEYLLRQRDEVRFSGRSS